jgi:small nuclear ribonucleoprotein (snRNP)-like protein
MLQNKIVVRYQDGRILKGTTGDFLPAKPLFHLMVADAPPGAKPVEITVAELKAVFFVHDLVGNPSRKEVLEFHVGKPAVGRKIQVEFKDGEKLVGTTQGYDPSRAGFFVVPVDAASNNQRCFVVIRATKAVTFL